MSTAQVLDDTLARARGLGLRAALLAPGFDVDTSADLAHLARARREGRTPAPARARSPGSTRAARGSAASPAR